MVTKVMTVGVSRLKPADCFIAKAQATSSAPATTKYIQATVPSFYSEARSSWISFPVRGRSSSSARTIAPGSGLAIGSEVAAIEASVVGDRQGVLIAIDGDDDQF